MCSNRSVAWFLVSQTQSSHRECCIRFYHSSSVSHSQTLPKIELREFNLSLNINNTIHHQRQDRHEISNTVSVQTTDQHPTCRRVQESLVLFETLKN